MLSYSIRAVDVILSHDRGIYTRIDAVCGSSQSVREVPEARSAVKLAITLCHCTCLFHILLAVHFRLHHFESLFWSFRYQSNKRLGHAKMLE